jgi:hypothetical protein
MLLIREWRQKLSCSVKTSIFEFLNAAAGGAALGAVMVETRRVVVKSKPTIWSAASADSF